MHVRTTHTHTPLSSQLHFQAAGAIIPDHLPPFDRLNSPHPSPGPPGKHREDTRISVFSLEWSLARTHAVLPLPPPPPLHSRAPGAIIPDHLPPLDLFNSPHPPPGPPGKHREDTRISVISPQTPPPKFDLFFTLPPRGLLPCPYNSRSTSGPPQSALFST